MTARCGEVGALTVGGRVVGQIRCELDAGHDDPMTAPLSGYYASHRASLEWTPEAEPDLDLFDPDERFDVNVEL